MGWMEEDMEGHEGHAVGVVERGDPGLWRELSYPGDDKRCNVSVIQAGCECGWRSPRLAVSGRWFPFSVELAKADEDRVRELWKEHIAQEKNRPTPLLFLRSTPDATATIVVGPWRA